MKTHIIARLIDLVTTATLMDALSVDECSELTAALWEHSHLEGNREDVAQLLQDKTDVEMDAAIAESLRRAGR
jgi:hypothetical protein